MAMQTAAKRARKGEVSDHIMEIGLAVVVLFIVLYMVTKVSGVTAIANTSDFYTTYTALVTNVKTIFDVQALVLIIVALGVGILYLKVFGKSAGGGGAGAI